MQTTTENQTNRTPETPKSIKELFKDYLFPCRANKKPAVQPGTSWEHGNELKKPLFRSTEARLCGVDCGQSRLIVADCDTYKEEFQKDKGAKQFLKALQKKCQYYYRTQSGGWHFYLKQPPEPTPQIRSSDPFPGIEIKATGKYVCVYGHPAEFQNHKDFDSFYADLPVFDFKDLGKEQPKQRGYGPGQNNRANAREGWIAGIKQDPVKSADNIIQLIKKNKNNPGFELRKHLIDHQTVYQKSIIKNIPSDLDFSEPPKNEMVVTNKSKGGYNPKDKKSKKKGNTEPSQSDIVSHLTSLRDDLLSKIDPDTILPTDFFDKYETKPKNNMVLISGDTESGKTAHSLKEIEGYLKKGIPCTIWEHSETNRFNRLNQWIKDNGLSKTPLFMSIHRQDILDHFEAGSVVLIDDTDSFFHIQNPIARREVADAIEALSWITQLVGFTCFCCHYQSKTSKNEKTATARSGGSMTWINKARYALLIEKAVRDTETAIIGNELNEERTETEQKTCSFIKVQKGNRTKGIADSWWLKEDYTIGTR